MCRARAVSDGTGANVVLITEGVHDHAPDRELAEAEKVKFELKRRAEINPREGPSTILRDVLSQTTPGVIAHLPERANLKKSLRTVMIRNMPANPKNIDDLGEMPPEYRTTATGEPFLMYDSAREGEIPGRVLIPTLQKVGTTVSETLSTKTILTCIPV